MGLDESVSPLTALKLIPTEIKTPTGEKKRAHEVAKTEPSGVVTNSPLQGVFTHDLQKIYEPSQIAGYFAQMVICQHEKSM